MDVQQCRRAQAGPSRAYVFCLAKARARAHNLRTEAGRIARRGAVDDAWHASGLCRGRRAAASCMCVAHDPRARSGSECRRSRDRTPACQLLASSASRHLIRVHGFWLSSVGFDCRYIHLIAVKRPTRSHYRRDRPNVCSTLQLVLGQTHMASMYMLAKRASVRHCRQQSLLGAALRVCSVGADASRVHHAQREGER